MTGRAKLTSSTPLFVVSDLTRSVEFYVQELAFQDPSLWGEPPCFGLIHRDGVEIARLPERTVYNMIEMEIVDPDGYRICLGQDTK